MANAAGDIDYGVRPGQGYHRAPLYDGHVGPAMPSSLTVLNNRKGTGKFASAAARANCDAAWQWVSGGSCLAFPDVNTMSRPEDASRLSCAAMCRQWSDRDNICELDRLPGY